MPLSRINAQSLTDGTIVASEIADGAITTAKIADDAITSAKVDTNIAIGGTLNVSGAFTSQGIDDNADAVALEITSSEDVVIKHGTNNAKLVFNDQSNSSNIFIQQIGSSGSPALRFFESTGDERMRLHNGGILSVNQGVALGVGSNNTSSNVLNDYEEGHWTPTVGGWTSVTFSYRAASYVKIGHMCHVNCSIRFSGTSAGSTVQINGLPFLQELNANNHGSGTGAIGYQTLSTVTNHTVSTVYVVQGTTRVQLYTMGGSAVNASSNASNLWFEFSAVYPTQ